MLIKLKNRRGDFAVTLVVILALVLVGIALFSFSAANKAYSATISNPNRIDNVYLQEDNTKFYLTNSLEDAYIETFYECVSDDFCFTVSEKNADKILVFDKVWNEDEKFNEKFKENFGKRIGNYNLGSLKLENIKLSFSGNKITAIIENIDMKAEIADENVDNIDYKTNIESSIDVDELGLNSIKDISDSWEKCRILSELEKGKCYRENLGNYGGSVELVRKDNNGNVLSGGEADKQIAQAYTIVNLKSKDKFFIDKEGNLIYSNIEIKFVDRIITK
ncbi:hypothetical protein COU57_03730 [Candidatus Pacearchaeota archaeon CG10_big_fil_rev_8_21_14_0_10_32_14]|nr:MAG: hypothetical protein COU57_03730 [Candidatus Pacearchaeota archaeon CG10_big_fil_rev_8_21_14_0_10_32_14]